MQEKLEWKNEKRKVIDLIPAGYNPRKISEKQKQDLMESIRQFNAVVPVVINADNTMIGGHQRLSIYADLGIEEIDVRVPSRKLTEKEEKELNLRLNQNGGEWDPDKLHAMDPDMLLNIGFSTPDLADLWDTGGTSNDEFDEESALKKAKTTEIKQGDIFELGGHRVMCGDSTQLEAVSALMGGGRASVIYCDPPYNIGLDYDKGVGNTKGKYQGEYTSKKDSKSDIDYISFVGKTLDNALKFIDKSVHVFYWCDERFIWVMQMMYKEKAIENKRVCLWVKNNASPTPGLAFNKAYEPCVYGTIGRPFLNNNYRAYNEFMNQEIGTGNQMLDDIADLFNLWLVDRGNTQGYKHPTQKPVTLHEKPLKRCSAPGQIVVDLFGGSGSTLIACEQLGRRSFLMELDPIFCQVIVDRWENLTGNKAKKI